MLLLQQKKTSGRFHMTSLLTAFWAGFLRPLLRRPERVQLAALCYRAAGDDAEVLLVTSRDTGRWIIPKGWPIDGKDSGETALQEAWEEAGVREGRAETEAVGTYTYKKRFNSGWSAPVKTIVYPVAVTQLRNAFPEADQRERGWFRPQEAAGLVQEPELKQLLLDFETAAC